jgi:hypothetical protein
MTEAKQCDHCGKPITDEYPTNYHVRMTDEDEWAIHVEWHVGMLENDFRHTLADDDLDENSLHTLQWEAQRLERAVKAQQKLLAMIREGAVKLGIRL